MSKWKSRLLRVGGLLSLCVVYLLFFGAQTFFALWARKIGRQIPIVKSVPVDLTDLSVSQARGERISFKGGEFEVPWDDVDLKKTRVTGNWLVVALRSGKALIFTVEAADGFIESSRKDKTPDPELFKAIYGPDVLASDYTLYKAIFETTPSQFNLFTPARRAAGLSSVILVKAIMPPTTDWAIYKVQSQNFQGFQLGDPVRHPNKMCLELFTTDAHFEVSLVQNAATTGPSITQAELNRIIQSIHKVAPAAENFTITPL